MGWPQIVMIVLYSLTCFSELLLDGKPRTGKYNFVARLISTAIVVWILGKGGFWR